MNNLKRVLSLALSGIMLVGMMTVGAGAANKDFTDKSEITHTEAVNVMSTLGVLKGKDTGAFDPKTTVTRAEMAKIICVMLNGGNDPTVGTGGNPKFSDVTTHWARGYIEYCANLKIIAGQGDGTFAPDAPVTGSAAAKMLMVALGYDSDISGFVGPDWQLSVDSEANKAKLYVDIRGIDTSAGLSRDDTAQMAYNAMGAKIMERTDNKVLGTGEISYSYAQSKTTTFLNKYFDAKVFVGTFEANDKTDSSLTKGYIKVTGDLDTAVDPEEHGAEFPAELDISNLGEEVKVIFREGKVVNDMPDKKDTIYGVFNTGATETVIATVADVKELKSADQKIQVGGAKYSLEDEVAVITNYVGDGVTYDKTTPEKQLNNGSSDGGSDLTIALRGNNGGARGDSIRVLLRNSKVYRIYITASDLAIVTAINSEKITLSNNFGTFKLADNSVAEDVKKGDVVEVTRLYSEDAEEGYTTVTKAEKVSGEVVSFKDQENVKMNDTTYKVYDEREFFNTKVDEGKQNWISKFSAEHVGKTFDMYLVNGFVRAAVLTSETANNYSVVLAVSEKGVAGDPFKGLKLNVMDADGVETVLEVSGSSAKTNSADYGVGDLITYTMDKKNAAVVTIKSEFDSGKKTNDGSYNKATKVIKEEAAELAVSTDCVLFTTTVTDGSNAVTSKVKAYKLRDLGNISMKGGKWSIVSDANDKVVAVYADLGAKPAGASSSEVYGIVSEVVGVVQVDGHNYKQYTAMVNGEIYPVNLPTTASLTKGTLITFAPVSDSIYTRADIVDVAAGQTVIKGYLDDYSDGVIRLYTSVQGKNADGETASSDIDYYKGTAPSTYAVKSDVKIYYVDKDANKSSDNGAIDSFSTSTGKANVIVILDDTTNKNVIAMIVETSGKADII